MGDAYDNPFERYSYRSELIEHLRSTETPVKFGRVSVQSAHRFGFCWGVDRAVAMVRDAIQENPGRQIWLLDQIIHNPRVNSDFKEQGVRFLRGPFADKEAQEEPQPEDMVVIPAFSATVEDTEWLETVGCTVVDTTCPWVIKPHKRSLNYVKDGFTTLIHGLVLHEETMASCSLIASKGGAYLVVADREQAGWVCDTISGVLSGETLLGRLPDGAVSEGFEPQEDLEKVGTINQTTMLASETRSIEGMVRKVLIEKHGAMDVDQHFRELNTICGATQDNQDAVEAMAEGDQLTLLIVVGGFDSSNTRNLTRVGHDRFPSYHVDGPDAIDQQSIHHRCPESHDFVDTSDWLPKGDVTIGFTAGASTPDTLLAETIRRVLEVAGTFEELVLPS
ncbi:MAG: 4-hydroxy-3-methylbut-2-enyl diphosphate reductase [Planctomycetota bacterium]|nr:4-hydroxy-3-methylbut-2-enyl diphosphate reductase [Planctomycetota bacterium]